MKVLGFGAVLWDDIVDPAAPPADSVAGEANIGGAVFTVVVHLQRLGYAVIELILIQADLGESRPIVLQGDGGRRIVTQHRLETLQ